MTRRLLAGILLFMGCTTGISAAGTLIVSNYPEEIIEPGILVSTPLAEPITRLMYYHVNRATIDYTIQTTLQNISPTPVTIQVRKAIGGPSKDGIYAGHRSAKAFWTSILENQSNKVTIGGYQRVAILSHPFRSNMISTAILEFETDTPAALRLYSGIVDPAMSETSFLNQPSTPYTFGRFSPMSKPMDIKYNFELPVREIPIGGDPFLFDPATGILLRGNYGLDYDVRIQVTNPTASTREFNLFFAPAGGIARGVFLVNGQLVETGFIDHKNNLAPEKIYSVYVKPGALIQVRIQTLPQGGCFYPVNLVISSPVPTSNKESR